MEIDVRFSDRARYLGVISPESGSVVVWRLDSGQHVCTIEQDSPSVAIFDEDKNELRTASAGSTVLYVQLPRQDEALWTFVPGITVSLAFGPDGKIIAWTGTPVSEDLRAEVGGSHLFVVDTRSGAVLVDAALAEHCAAVFDPAGTRIAAVGAQGVREFDLQSGKEQSEPSNAASRIVACRAQRFSKNDASPTERK